MEDDTGASEDERSIELSSIEAIFPELKIDPENSFAAALDILVHLETPLKILFRGSASSPSDVVSLPGSVAQNGVTAIDVPTAPLDVHELSFLPPLHVEINLPQDYPSASPPTVGLSANPSWLPESMLESLTKSCERLWNDIGRDQVVYTYIDHLQQEAESAFGIRLAEGHHLELPDDLKISLLDFDLKKRREHFEKESFECGICLEPKKGILCHRLILCGHVFCIACLQDFYNNAITEGDVDSVKCLAPGCGKEEIQDTPTKKRRKHDRTLNPSELLQIPIDQEHVQRYVQMKRKKKLEADKTTVYCPRQWCQGAARSKKHPKPSDPLGDFTDSTSESEQETASTNSGKRKKKKLKWHEIPMSERLSVCEDCDFAFCSVCKKGWHGEIAMCNPRRTADLDAEEKATLAYLKQYSTPCPTCSAPAQKTMGCNHMICFQCKTHFCYLCSAFLMPENPYAHFNDAKSSCHMRLWELEEGDGLGAGHNFAGGEVNPMPMEPQIINHESDSDTGGSDDDNDDDIVVADLAHNGVVVQFEDDDDTDDSEPAPDQRRPGRNRHIEIVNFAGNGAHQRIQLPDLPQQIAPPPAAPIPPRRIRNRRGGGRVPLPPRHRNQAHHHHNNNNNNHNNNRRAIADNEIEVEMGPNGLRIRGNPPGGLPPGLERFLQLALNDQEDEWDSDELDEDHL